MDRVRTDYALSLAPRQAVRCVARNAEQSGASFRAQIQEADTLVSEVHVRQGDVLAAIAHVAPWKSGSAVTIWRNASIVDARFADAMAEGC